MSERPPNVDERETARFAALADTWWDPNGSSRPLHLLNPVRLGYVHDATPLAGQRVLDVGCGAGLLSEAMAELGAEVTAIDATEEVLGAARLHALESGADVHYALATAEQWLEQHAGGYDVVTCMELIEHVPDPASLVSACVGCARPNGSVFVSTINRTPKAWLLAVVAAEYVLGLLPRGTHDYRRLVRPSELDHYARRAGARLDDVTGMAFNPVLERFRLCDDVAVNYIARLVRDDAR